jgi:hypothetical protein
MRGSMGKSMGRSEDKKGDRGAGAMKEFGHEGEHLSEHGSKDSSAELAKIHPHAAGATHSFHVYKLKDGSFHAHAHTHEGGGGGDHTEEPHPDMASVHEHMKEHMGDEMADAEHEEPLGALDEGKSESAGDLKNLGISGGMMA